MFQPLYSASNDVVASLLSLNVNEYPHLIDVVLNFILKKRPEQKSLEYLAARKVIDCAMNNTEAVRMIAQIIERSTPQSLTPLVFGNCLTFKNVLIGSLMKVEHIHILIYSNVIHILFGLTEELTMRHEYTTGTFSSKLAGTIGLFLMVREEKVSFAISSEMPIRPKITRWLDNLATQFGLHNTRMLLSDGLRHLLRQLSPQTRFLTRTYSRRPLEVEIQ